ncbi:MAG: hypothetical protein WCC12_21655 [Anaerolineales bacterium]
MRRKPVQSKVVALIGMIIVLGVFALAIFSPQVSKTDQFTGIATFLLFTAFISFALLSRRLGKSLGRKMRASSAKSRGAVVLTAETDLPGTKRRSLPSQPFAYQVFDMNSTPALSAGAEAVLKRAYKHYQGYVVNLAVGALFLWLSFSVLSATAAVLRIPLSVPTELLCGSALGLLAAFFAANPRRHPTSWTIIVWAALNLILLAVIIFVAIRSGVLALTSQSTAFVLLGLAAASLLAYGVLFAIVAFTLRRRVAANKPLQLLALWVFNSGTNLVSILSGLGLIWRFLGTIQFLRGGEFTVDMESLVKRGEADQVADSPEKLERELQAFQYFPTWSGTYPTNTLLCNDSVWKPAVHALLRNSDAVAMSLFGFSQSNQGCLYELGLLLDMFPISRVLFLIDDTTDLEFLLATLRQNWDQMAVDSPNHTAIAAPIRIYRLSTRFDRLGEAYTSGQPGEAAPLKALGAFSATQSGTTREVDCMIRLILEGVVC